MFILGTLDSRLETWVSNDQGNIQTLAQSEQAQNFGLFYISAFLPVPALGKTRN